MIAYQYKIIYWCLANISYDKVKRNPLALFLDI